MKQSYEKANTGEPDVAFACWWALLPTAAFAAEGTFPTEQAEQLAICTCEVLCTEDGKDETCTVCVKDYTLCEAQAGLTTTEQENGMDTSPAARTFPIRLARSVRSWRAVLTVPCPGMLPPVCGPFEWCQTKRLEEVPAPVEPAGRKCNP